jgi:hypothetical protein
VTPRGSFAGLTLSTEEDNVTAFKDAFEKAGMNTAGAELYKLATDALRGHGGSAEKTATKFCQMLKKREDLLRALALEFLRGVAADMGTQAPASIKNIKVREHKRHRPRSEEERTGALIAAGTAVEALRSIFDERHIDGRPIGDLRWGELQGMVHTNANNAASYLRLGTEATENAILLDKIEAFAQVEDHSRKIRQVLSAADLERLAVEARREAPRLVELGMKYYATTIEQRRARELTP